MSTEFRYEHVLLIDNRVGNDIMNKNVIEHSGLGEHAVVKSNGAEAIDYLISVKKYPELIIFNNKLPVFDGVPFLCELESLPIVTMGQSELLVLASKQKYHDINQLVIKGRIRLFDKPFGMALCEELVENNGTEIILPDSP